jgi:hypothetical protein
MNSNRAQAQAAKTNERLLKILARIDKLDKCLEKIQETLTRGGSNDG